MVQAHRRFCAEFLLVAAVLSAVPACTTPESHTDLPGYRFEYPRDLPKTYTAYGKSGKPFEADARARCKSEHEAGWRECFRGYQHRKVELSQPCRAVPGCDPDSLEARGRRDGYEECRRLLLENGNR